MEILYNIERLYVVVLLIAYSALLGIGSAINISELIRMGLERKKEVNEERELKRFLKRLDRQIENESRKKNTGRNRPGKRRTNKN